MHLIGVSYPKDTTKSTIEFPGCYVHLAPVLLPVLRKVAVQQVLY